MERIIQYAANRKATKSVDYYTRQIIMPKNAEILVSGIGRMRLAQAESEIKKMREESSKYKTEGEDDKARRMLEKIKPYQDAVSRFYKVTSHRRGWI